ncbi:esterase-like activity of phytase family protein [Aquincola sp. S2]|uniref:Esterase-like activity of phytase family protein n=1 Tax=Pseudaquabacterium terrae TaxID=2732868 RepID=A0ABX2EMB6_9BURK|nr:esterase-like activity of phytase family protein [Aquabacterium terrae]NRF69784.1 esterase-like activity of phytase family protein [Aquabacterium terrae]
MPCPRPARRAIARLVRFGVTLRLAGAAAALACSAPQPHWPRAVQALQPLGAVVLPRSADGPARHLGGISGADFDPASGRWWLLSDDRGEHAPVRAYELRLPIAADGAGTPQVLGVVTLKRPDGQPFARFGADGEALRFDPCRGELLWASEGDPAHGAAPFVRRAAPDGRFLGELSLPPNLNTPPGSRRGPRPNRSFEGLGFTPDGRTLWLALESPLLEDGPLPTTGAGAMLRFTRFERPRADAPLVPAGQFAYPVDALPRTGSGGGGRADNGVSELLPIDAKTLLVIERAGHEVADGRFGFRARLYIAELAGADDVGGFETLAGARFTPLRKRLLLDLGATENIEAAAWGPRLPDGRATLLLVSDDNFAPHQPTMLRWFAVSER